MRRSAMTPWHMLADGAVNLKLKSRRAWVFFRGRAYRSEVSCNHLLAWCLGPRRFQSGREISGTESSIGALALR